MAWVYLLLAGLFEIGFTTFLKLSDGFSRFWPSLGFLVCAAISFWLLTRAAAVIPMGTAYAVWTGIGTVGTVACGIWLFGDSVTPMRLVCIGLIVAGIVGLKIVS